MAILLIIILSAAGAIACYRTHQQDQIINSLTERMIQSENGSPSENSYAVDGSNGSLCQGCQVNPVSMISVSKNGLLTPPDGSHASIVQPVSKLVASGVAVKAKQKYQFNPSCEERTNLLDSGSPSTSEDSKPPLQNDQACPAAEISARPRGNTSPILHAVNNHGGDYVITIDRPPN